MENQEKKIWIKPELVVDDIEVTGSLKSANSAPEGGSWHSGIAPN